MAMYKFFALIRFGYQDKPHHVTCKQLDCPEIFLRSGTLLALRSSAFQKREYIVLIENNSYSAIGIEFV